MRNLFAVAALLLCSTVARGYEYHLQLPAIAGARSMVAIGEQFNADGSVSGPISYYAQSCSSGRVRVCGPKEFFNLTGTWDAQGNLIGSEDTPWTAQPVLYANGTEQVYAAEGTSTTGVDTRGTLGFGYIDVQASHYTFQQPPGGYVVIPDTPYTFELTVLSDGDLPLNVSDANVSAIASGYYTYDAGTATIIATGLAGDCLSGPVAPGTSCTLAVTFDPAPIACTGSPYGYAYNILYLAIVSDAGNIYLQGWNTHFTITGVRLCDD